MYFPRRYRRKLLFPPGLLALSVLLLLGCMRIAKDQRFRPQYVLQFSTMLNCDKNYSILDNGLISRWCYTQQELGALRIWRDYSFTSNAFSNWWIIQASQQHLDKLQRFPNSVDGIRFCFGSDAFYGNVIQVLDMLTKQKKDRYIVDNRGKMLTIYAFAEEIVMYP
ncbi:hypothetical protein [Hymenobacter sp. GOD-10R]|uniref:hypothetical protein n=1 Tax=Hymenobacter sp. GOD-10R TaxID=3093922 RepID=UPI002D767CEC|nr:hypothetical protein [Hymenobacter sp. GOD-10R]WRQ27141.1 hypothetical protein SD425_18880 [Hymenobacter sp. GOD-10R]